MAFDPTPGFNLGITDAWRKVTNVANSFQGAGGNKVVASNPGASKNTQPNSSSQPRPQKAATNDPGETAADPGSVLGASTTSYDPADVAYLDAQANTLRDMLARSGNTLNQGITNLSDSYNKQVSTANSQRSRALEDFGIQREDNNRDRTQDLSTVDTNARTLNDSVRRLLGQAAGSGSSAYQYAAPNAVARTASSERNKVLDANAENDRNIGVAEKRATDDFQTMLDELLSQRNQKEGDLRAGVLQNEQGINSNLAELAAKRAAVTGGSYGSIMAAQQPFQQAVNDRQAQIDSLFERFRSPTYDVKPVSVQAPTLRDYAVTAAGINTGAAAAQDPSQTYGYYRKKNQESL
jgi:vacuolar-type H+-ATPase subunit H